MRLLIILFLSLFITAPAFAQSAGDARAELSAAKSEIQASDAREKQLQAKRAAVEKELASLQKDMVRIATDVAAQEKELAEAEEKLEILEQQKTDKKKILDARQKGLSELISAMVKLRQLPPEAVIAMPGKLDETLATARALGVVSHAIEAEAESLKGQLRELDALEEKIKGERTVIAARKDVLAARQKKLEARIKERTKLQTSLGGKEMEERQRQAKLSAKSQNLQELIDSLGRSEHNYVWEQKTPSASWQHTTSAGTKHRMRSFVRAKGDLHLPAGKLVSRFGGASKGAAFSKGIVVDARSGASVLAPYDGEVVFAGPFRDYGRMIIIRHSDDYHTLIAGMDSLSAQPGQFLLEGEPIGAMAKRATATRLYIELRKDGKPVDPLPWFEK